MSDVTTHPEIQHAPQGDVHPTTAQEPACCGPSCCTGDDEQAESAPAQALPAASATVRQTVRQGYARIATGQARSCCGSAARGCGHPEDLVRAIGYDEGELATLPEEANMGLSCGNPTALEIGRAHV